MGKKVRSKRFKSKKVRYKKAMSKKVGSKRFKSKRNYKKTMKKRINKIKNIKIKKGGEVLGEGGFGEVKLYKINVRDRHRDACFAKKLAKRGLVDKDVEDFIREFEILKQMNHPNIVKVFRMGEGGGLYFYLEFCNAGDLYKYIKNKNADVRNEDCLEDSNRYFGGGIQTMNDGQKNYVIRGILSGLKHIHDNGYIHCDIKPDNILLTYDGEKRDVHRFTPKIADFGLTTRVTRGEKCGTTRYKPVECLVHAGKSQDFWGCAMTLYEFICMHTVASSDYGKCIDKKYEQINIDELHAWNEFYLGDNLKRTLPKSTERECFRDLLYIPSYDTLDEFNVVYHDSVTDFSKLDFDGFYTYCSDIRERGFNGLCELYRA